MWRIIGVFLGRCCVRARLDRFQAGRGKYAERVWFDEVFSEYRNDWLVPANSPLLLSDSSGLGAGLER